MSTQHPSVPLSAPPDNSYQSMDKDAPRITIVTEYFYPEEASTAQLLTSLATGLEGDFDMSVLTGRPNYHPGDETESVPTRRRHLPRPPAVRP